MTQNVRLTILHVLVMIVPIRLDVVKYSLYSFSVTLPSLDFEFHTFGMLSCF